LEKGVNLNQTESEENGLLNINVTIYDRQYKLKVRPEEEESVRNAAKRISEKVKELQEQFAGKDKQDFLAMAALLIATEIKEPEQKQIPVVEQINISTELDQLNQQILKAINF
jgi:cell division protein ZapA (FtsZ GTPase activity inhibitor)